VPDDATRIALERIAHLEYVERELARLDRELEALMRIRGRAAERVMEAKLRVLFGAAVVWLLMVGSAYAQIKPVVLVMGKGAVVFDVTAPTLADAQAYVYKAYVDALAPITLTVLCGKAAAPFECAFSLAQLPLKTTHTLSLTASLVAADGTVESAKSAAPFDLRLAAPPVAPVASSIAVRPQP
jgi:hypothetical protein